MTNTLVSQLLSRFEDQNVRCDARSIRTAVEKFGPPPFDLGVFGQGYPASWRPRANWRPGARVPLGMYPPAREIALNRRPRIANNQCRRVTPKPGRIVSPPATRFPNVSRKPGIESRRARPDRPKFSFLKGFILVIDDLDQGFSLIKRAK
jgi:hypothetical protein